MALLWVCFVFLVTLCVFGSLYKLVPLLLRIRKWHAKLDGQFPHLPFHWIWGSLHHFKSPRDIFAITQKFVDEGARIHMFWFGFFRPVVMAVHPETVKVILKSSEPKARGGGGYDFLLPWLGDGLLVSSGKKWERNRRLLTPAFHFDILQPYVQIYNHSTKGFLKRLEDQSYEGKSVEVFGPAGLSTLDTMLQCALSYTNDIQEKGGSHPYVKSVTDLSRLLIKRSFNLVHYIDFIYYFTKDGKEFKKVCDYVHDFAEKIIESRKKALASDPDLLKKRHLDFLDILLTARDETGQGLTDKEIRDEVDTFMFEGHDTTSSAISWCLYCLARYPEEQQKVLQEVQKVLGDKEEVEWEDLAKLQYVPLFIKESLRLYPPVPMISRQLKNPLVLDGVEIPRGVIVDVSLFHTHRNLHVWDDCLEFNPSRFDSEASVNRDPYCFVPFAAGPRNCIGQNFAMNELKVMLCHTVRRFQIDLDPDRLPVLKPELVLRSENGLYLKFKQRSH